MFRASTVAAGQRWMSVPSDLRLATTPPFHCVKRRSSVARSSRRSALDRLRVKHGK